MKGHLAGLKKDSTAHFSECAVESFDNHLLALKGQHSVRASKGDYLCCVVLWNNFWLSSSRLPALPLSKISTDVGHEVASASPSPSLNTR